MKTARWAGIMVQALMLGALLALAMAKLAAVQSGARIFQYQAF